MFCLPIKPDVNAGIKCFVLLFENAKRKQFDASNMKLPTRLFHAGGLVFFQLLGLFIPLLTLPIMAHGLGVAGFGQVMLAQSVTLLAVLWIDAGFNTESQRRAAQDLAQEIHAPQALIDNLLARGVCALPALLILSLLPLVLPSLSYLLLLACSPLILGTLLFPQWWLVATGHGWQMGFWSTIGRLFSALLTWLWVKNEQDIVWAALSISLGSLVSGLLLSRIWLKPLVVNRAQVKWRRWRQYLFDVRANLISAFLAQASSQLPLIVIGALPSGSPQIGIFSAADRLTRAAAHVFGSIEQSVMASWLMPLQGAPEAFHAMRKRIMRYLLFALGLSAVVGFWFSEIIVTLLYGLAFKSAIVVLYILIIWLCLHTLRRTIVMMYWSTEGDIAMQARLQWSEVILTSLVLACTGALSMFHIFEWITHSIAAGMAMALCCVEVLLLCICINNLTAKTTMPKDAS